MLAAGSDGDSQQEIYDVMNLGHLEGMDYVTNRLLLPTVFVKDYGYQITIPKKIPWRFFIL